HLSRLLPDGGKETGIFSGNGGEFTTLVSTPPRMIAEPIKTPPAAPAFPTWTGDAKTDLGKLQNYLKRQADYSAYVEGQPGFTAGSDPTVHTELDRMESQLVSQLGGNVYPMSPQGFRQAVGQLRNIVDLEKSFAAGGHFVAYQRTEVKNLLDNLQDAVSSMEFYGGDMGPGTLPTVPPARPPAFPTFTGDSQTDLGALRDYLAKQASYSALVTAVPGFVAGSDPTVHTQLDRMESDIVTQLSGNVGPMSPAGFEQAVSQLRKIVELEQGYVSRGSVIGNLSASDRAQVQNLLSNLQEAISSMEFYGGDLAPGVLSSVPGVL
ncbi:MAG: hypothetical protein KGR26_02785, partial [Cyanobacteria bacterium REEB65]|nr:hypothetical protein [Cyanobacteria bacterium REEB65]